MEVDGGLSVTEGVSAASFVGNGGGITGIGIKPERIYLYKTHGNSSFTVPQNKVWSITFVGYAGYMSYIDEDGNTSNLFFETNRGHHVWVLQNMNINLNILGSDDGDGGLFNIFEYSITGSGTDQGMDYVEP